MTVNGISVRRGAQSSGVLFTVYFCPEDLFLIRDGAAARRKLMDTALCQLRPKYAQALMRYNKAYESKTRILRDSESGRICWRLCRNSTIRWPWPGRR